MLFYKLIILVVSILPSFASLSQFVPDFLALNLNQFEVYWREFKSKYNKRYASPMEESFRMSIFSENLQMIQEHNQAADRGEKPFKLSVNRFSDMLSSEYDELDMETANHVEEKGFLEVFKVDLERAKMIRPSKDWRKLGVVNPCIDQLNCGACWALSALTAIEARLALRTGRLRKLSVQQLLDCSTNNAGCDGGLMTVAFSDLVGSDGLVEDAKYPYTRKQGKCRAQSSSMKPKFARIKGFGIVESMNETALRYAVHEVGPVTVGIDSRPLSFRFYWKGIYDDVFCSDNLNHAVAIVGYGSDEIEGDYWIIKNSWGLDWGENGFARIRRGKNLCGISLIPSYPILAD